MIFEKTVIDVLLILIFSIFISAIFIWTYRYGYKKTKEKNESLWKEKIAEQEIATEQMREEYIQQLTKFGGSFTEQDIRIKQLQKDNEQQVIKTNLLQEKYDKELHFRKSSEVRLGKIGENLAPFLNGWPWVPRQFRFLGNPVDGIQFNDDEIIFVEIKTGKARLSKSQKNTKELIKTGKVSFVTFKITDDGTKLIKDTNN